LVVELAALRGQLAHRPGKHDPARRQQRDLVTQRGQIVHPVAGEDHRRTRDREVGEDLVDLPLTGRVEAVGRLVQHQQLRFAEQGCGQPEPLPHAEGEAAEGVPGHLAESDPFEHFVNVGRATALLTAEGGQRREVLASRQGWIEAGTVDESRDTSGHGKRAPHRRPEDLQAAAVGHCQAEQEAQERGLPGSVGSHEAMDLPGCYVEIDTVEGDDVAEGLGDTARPDGSDRRHGGLLDPEKVQTGKLHGRN